MTVAVFCLSLQTVHAQVPNADTMIRKIFASLQAKDEKAFVALYPNAEQFGRFIRGIMEQTMKSEEIRKLMAMDEKTKGMNLDSLVEAQITEETKPEKFAKTQAQFGKTFQQIVDKGEKKGVNWSQAKLTSYTIDSSAFGGKEGMPFQLTGLKEAKGVIDFSVGDSAYQLAFGKMMWIEKEGGWFGADFPQLARKGESLEPDKSDLAEADEMMSDTTAEVVEAPKASKGAKTKKPVAKTGTKAKAPARKPKAKS
jgi:hypothetical protein